MWHFSSLKIHFLEWIYIYRVFHLKFRTRLFPKSQFLWRNVSNKTCPVSIFFIRGYFVTNFEKLTKWQIFVRWMCFRGFKVLLIFFDGTVYMFLFLCKRIIYHRVNSLTCNILVFECRLKSSLNFLKDSSTIWEEKVGYIFKYKQF